MGRYNNQKIDANFEDYLQSKCQREDPAIETDSTPPCLDAASSPPALDTPNFVACPPENIPSRPSLREETPLRWQPQLDDSPRLSSSMKSNVSQTVDIWAQRGMKQIDKFDDTLGKRETERSDRTRIMHLESLDD